jgi:UDP-N-acetylmuramate dehydrogenase
MAGAAGDDRQDSEDLGVGHDRDDAGQMPKLAELTTLRLGGPAARFVETRTEDELVAAVREVDLADESALVLAGGSNLIVADDGFPGTVVHVLTRGVERQGNSFTVQAGEPWDPFVAARVEDGFAGLECLSGIPGSTGATPIQNVGAYGQEVAEVITSVRVLNRADGEILDLSPSECGFSYRASAFKREPGEWVVLSVTFELAPQSESRPIRYAELARTLGIELGESAPLADVRDAVLALRRSKGMVIDPDDPDSVSAGSFFTNPILDPAHFEQLEERVAADLGPEAGLPSFPEPDGQVKTSAAWLVERAGFGRGYGAPGPIMVSTKHSLALTNRGGGTTAQLIKLAHEIQLGVRNRFGVELTPEPTFAGDGWAHAPSDG